MQEIYWSGDPKAISKWRLAGTAGKEGQVDRTFKRSVKAGTFLMGYACWLVMTWLLEMRAGWGNA